MLPGMAWTDFRRANSIACSRVIFTCAEGRWASTEERGVWAGVEAAEVDLFLLDLKRDMAEIGVFELAWEIEEGDLSERRVG